MMLLPSAELRPRLLRLALVLLLGSSVDAFCQSDPFPDTGTVASTALSGQTESAADKSSAKNQKKEKRNSRGAFVGVPIPISSPAIGSGVALMGGYLFSLHRNDPSAPASVIGVGALFTDNGSSGFAAGTELYFKDRYQLLTGYARADLNYNFYGTGSTAGDAGIKLGLNQHLQVFFVEATRRVFERIFAGPRLFLGTSTLAVQRRGETHPELPPLNVGFNLRALGFKIERDTTENRFYPQNGTAEEFSADFFDEALGSTFTFQRYRLTMSAYPSLTANQILAFNFHACATGGQAPFFGKCIFGTDNELRGYPAGQYIDRHMLATQIEYRVSLPRRFGLVAFAGVGEVAPSFGAFNYSNLLPSVGFGPRFQLSTKYHVNLRADFARGKNGHTFSMGLGEAF